MMNNYEFIKSMTIEEMAQWLQEIKDEYDKCLLGGNCTTEITSKTNITCIACKKGFKKWLNEEI